jgi:hypothetical protein
MLIYGVFFYRTSCDEVLSIISKKIAKLKIDELKKVMVEINRGYSRHDVSIPKIFEHLFKAYALNGIKWKCRQLKLKTTGIGSNSDDWTIFNLKLQRLVEEEVYFKDMEKLVLYYPQDASFPLVDLYYKDNDGKLVGIQATIETKHPKSESTYESFYRRIGATPEDTSLELMFLILPRQVDSYNRDRYPISKFWKNAESVIPRKWEHSINFHAVFPPDTFESSFPEYQDIS